MSKIYYADNVIVKINGVKLKPVTIIRYPPRYIKMRRFHHWEMKRFMRRAGKYFFTKKITPKLAWKMQYSLKRLLANWLIFPHIDLPDIEIRRVSRTEMEITIPAAFLLRSV